MINPNGSTAVFVNDWFVVEYVLCIRGGFVRLFSFVFECYNSYVEDVEREGGEARV